MFKFSFLGSFPMRPSFSPLPSSHPGSLTLFTSWFRSSAQTRGLRGPRGHLRGRQSCRGRGGGGERLEGLGSRYRPLESSGKCDRKEELRRSMKRCPQSQLCPDANVPAVGAKGQDTERVHQAGSMARPHRNLRPCWPVPRCYLSSR